MNGWLVALLITALILGILLLLRLGLRVEFAAEKTRFFLCVGCVRVPIHTGKKTKQQKEKNEKKRVENLSGEKKNAGKKKKPALRDMLDLIGEMGGVATRLIKRICIRELSGRITAGGTDAASAAIAYGRLCAVVGAVHALLERLVTVKAFDVGVELDYESGKIHAEGVLEVSFRILYILAALFGALKVLWRHRDLFRRADDASHKVGKRVVNTELENGAAEL